MTFKAGVEKNLVPRYLGIRHYNLTAITSLLVLVSNSKLVLVPDTKSASSAGVERVFSAAPAGKMHTDLQKSAKDSTLQHSLFAAFNTD